MEPKDEIVALLSAQPMVAFGLVRMTQAQYELLMFEVRAILMRRAKAFTLDISRLRAHKG